MGDLTSERLSATIQFLRHTSFIVELFSDKQVIYDVNDERLSKLWGVLQYFSNWKENVLAESEFISQKLWFDIQSMIFGFISIVKIKLNRFPGSLIKPAILNQDVLENHFSQLRAANGQNDNPSYQLVQATQNSVIFGQTTVSRKCNTGCTKNNSFVELPKDKVFGKKRKNKNRAAQAGLLFKS